MKNITVDFLIYRCTRTTGTVIYYLSVYLDKGANIWFLEQEYLKILERTV